MIVQKKILFIIVITNKIGWIISQYIWDFILFELNLLNYRKGNSSVCVQMMLVLDPNEYSGSSLLMIYTAVRKESTSNSWTYLSVLA